MSETIIIESADADAPLDPKLLREIRNLLDEDDDHDVGLRLTNRPPAPGEQGGIPVALEVLSVTSTAITPFVLVLRTWLANRSATIELRSGDQKIKLTAQNGDVQKLIADVTRLLARDQPPK